MATSTQLNLTALNDPSCFVEHIPHQIKIGSRVIYKYGLRDQQDVTLRKGITAIRALLQDNPNTLCATFADINELHLQANHYLTINGRAVCLSKKANASECPNTQYLDQYFSQNLLEEPVKCPQGHYMEKKSAQIWAQKMGASCPAGDHRIGDLTLDEDLQYYIKSYKESQQKQKDKIAFMNRYRKELISKGLSTETTIIHLTHENGSLQDLLGEKRDQLRETAFNMSSVVIKLVFKQATKPIAKEITKIALKRAGTELTKEAVKKSTQIWLKRVPVISLVIGIGLCANRCKKGEYIRGAIELTSGAVALIPPPWGTGLSCAIDAGLAVVDIKEALDNAAPNTPIKVQVTLSEEQAYMFLKLDPTIEHTQAQVDKAFRSMQKPIHPDHEGETGSNQRSFEMMTQYTTIARDFIYDQRGWGVPKV